MGRNIVLGFAGPGKVSKTSIEDLLGDYLAALPEDAEVRAIFPASDEYLSKTVLMLVDWAVDTDIPYEAIFDFETSKNKAILDDSAEDIEVDNVSLTLVNRLANAAKRGEEAKLVVAWGEDDEPVNRDATEKLVDLAHAKDIKVLDLTAALDDLRFDSEEEPEPEPEPEPARRPRRTTTRVGDTLKTKVDEPVAEEEKPRPRRGAPRKAASAAPEPAEAAEEESVEAEVSHARQKAQAAAETTPLEVGSDIVLHALIESFNLVKSLDTCHAAMTLKGRPEPSALTNLLREAIEKQSARTEVPEEKVDDASPRGGRPRSDGSPARKRTAAQRGKKQWQDEDGDWHDCGRGRPPKDVPLRTVDPKTGDVIDED
jgi:hypothetical protein